MEAVKTNTVMLVLRSGGDFHFRDVQLLASRIAQQCGASFPVKMYCMVDTISQPITLAGISLLPLPHPEWPGWWAKMNLFAPELEGLRPFLYMDLDTACVGSLSPLFPPNIKPEWFIMLRDFHRATHSASGVMWIPKGKQTSQIWDVWIKDPELHMRKNRGDQNFLEAVTKPQQQWQKVTPHIIHSFKPHRNQWLRDIPSRTSLVCFHGQPRIWEAAQKVQWVKKYVEEGLPSRSNHSKQPLFNKDRPDAWPYVRPWFSLLCPTRERPDMMARYVNSVYATARWPQRIETLVYIDDDDPKLLEYLQVLSGSPCKVIVGPSQGVGKAWNVLARASDGEYLMMANDDLYHDTVNWDQLILSELVKLPDGVFLAYCDDGINGKRHCAFPIVSRVWLNELNQFVPEKYQFFRHDTELFEIAKQIGQEDRILYIPNVRILHLHHSIGGERDATTERNRNDDQNEKDAKIYNNPSNVEKRKAQARRLRAVIAVSDHFNGDKFREIVGGKRVALVGPSPHLVGKNIGGYLDTYDVVCRVNELYPFGVETDYGSRTDLLFYGCNKNNYTNFEKALLFAQDFRPDVLEDFKMFMITQRRKDSANIISQKEFIQLLSSVTPSAALGMISMDHWNFYHRWILTHPNTGILALCMLAQAKPSELFLTGFSFYTQGGKPEQRHHPAYIQWGGDEGINEKKVIGGHDQEEQKEWFINRFLPAYGDVVTLDSFLIDVLKLADFPKEQVFTLPADL